MSGLKRQPFAKSGEIIPADQSTTDFVEQINQVTARQVNSKHSAKNSTGI